MKNLKDLINKRNVSIRQLSFILEISYPTLWSVLYNKHKPHKKTIKKICKYFNEDYKEYIE